MQRRDTLREHAHAKAVMARPGQRQVRTDAAPGLKRKALSKARPKAKAKR
jgi:hypothetical protein